MLTAGGHVLSPGGAGGAGEPPPRHPRGRGRRGHRGPARAQRRGAARIRGAGRRGAAGGGRDAARGGAAGAAQAAGWRGGVRDSHPQVCCRQNPQERSKGGLFERAVVELFREGRKMI